MTAEHDAALEKAIIDLLHARAAGKTICPSEASRHVFGAKAGLEKAAMARTRAAAARLVAAHKIEVTQKGEVVRLEEALGPIRLRLPQ